MPSFQISVSPSRRAAARYIERVRRELLKALAEENNAAGFTQSDIARAIGVHRSVINRELRGKKDITLGRVAELAFAMGRDIEFSLPQIAQTKGDNTHAKASGASEFKVTNTAATSADITPQSNSEMAPAK